MNTVVTEVYLFGECSGRGGGSCCGNAKRTRWGFVALIIAGNGIGDAGATAIAKTLRVNKSVTKIELLGTLKGT